MTFLPGIGDTGPLTGPLVLGYMLGSILVGILTMQVVTYYSNFPNDRPWIKWIVGVLFGLELFFTLFTLINAWVSFGPGWGDINTLVVAHWSLAATAPLSGIISLIVQFFFSYRIFRLTDSIWLPVLICMISCLQCAMAFYFTIVNGIHGNRFKTLYQLSNFATVWLVGNTVCDVLIAISTVTVLVKKKHASHFSKTGATLKRLIMLSIETGLVTATGATVELILFQTLKFLNYHYIFFLILGKLYSNALLAALNSRVHLQSERSGTGISTPNHLTLFEDEYKDMPMLKGGQSSTRIHVRRSVDVRPDNSHELVVVSTKVGSVGTDFKSIGSDFA